MVEKEKGYNPEKNEIQFQLHSELFRKYSANLIGMFEQNKQNLPKGTTVIRETLTEISINIPVTPDMMKSNEGSSTSMIILDKKEIDNTVRMFTSEAIVHKTKNTEFIPLSQYPIEALKKEIKIAVENERDLCIVEDMCIYNDFSNAAKIGKLMDFYFEHVILNYGDVDYCTAVTYIAEGDLKSLKKQISSDLKITSWG